MKKIILIISVLFAFKANSQTIFYYPGQMEEDDSTVEMFSMISYYSDQNSFDKKNIVKNNIHIKQSQIYNFDKKGNQKLSSCYINNYDKYGNNTSTLRYNNKNDLKSSTVLIFKDSSKVLSYVIKNWKGTITFKDSAIYNNMGRQTCEMEYRRKSVSLKRKTSTSYNDRGKILGIEYFKYCKNGKEKSKDKYLTTYNDDGTKGETKWYNGKGKLKYLWSFDCNPEGISERPILKDTTRVCVKYDYTADGSKMKTMIYTNRKNRITKTIEKYNPKGKLTEYTNYNRKNIITSKFIYTYNANNNNTGYEQYSRGGEKLKNKYIMEYNNNNQLTVSCWYHHADKLRSKYTYDYDENGMLKESIYYKKGVNKYLLNHYSYEYF